MILNTSSSRPDVHSQVSRMTAEFCAKSLSGDSTNTATESSSQVDFMKNALHLLTMLKHIVRHFEADSLKSMCELLLRMILLKDLVKTIIRPF